MQRLTPGNIQDFLQRRYAVKHFDPTKKIDQQTLDVIIESFHYAPSSANIQPRGLVVVTDEKVRKTLQTHAYGQSQIVDASHLLVLCRRTEINESRIDRIIHTTAMSRDQEIDDLAGLKNMQMNITASQGNEIASRASEQVAIAAGVVLTTCAALGVDACPIGGFVADEFDTVLGLGDKHLASTMVIAVGYRSESDTYATLPKSRLPKEEIVYIV